jgi:hypothetical protein
MFFLGKAISPQTVMPDGEQTITLYTAKFLNPYPQHRD